MTTEAKEVADNAVFSIAPPRRVRQESDTGLLQPLVADSENLLLHWLWESSVPLPGCPLHSRHSFSSCALLHLCRWLSPDPSLSASVPPFPLCLCSPPFLSFQRKINFLYSNAFSHFFFSILSCVLFLDIFPLLLSSLLTSWSIVVFLFILLLSNPSSTALTLCLHHFTHCSMLYEDYSHCLGWDC